MVSIALVLSDDFSGGSLGAGWQVVGPAEASVGFGGDATDAFLTLSTPDGNYDAWQANTAVRVMQAAADNDFQLKTRFLSTPTDRYQNQGFLVEQDAQNWLRFDTYSDGSRLYAFAAITVNGVTSFGFQVAIPGGSAPYLRLTRSGDDWTFEYSQNGSAWTVAGGLTHALTVSAAGLFSGNSDSATGYTALVDYFEVASDPILDEDGSYQPPNLAPQAGNDQLGTGIGAPLVISVGELLANDSDPNGDALSLVEIRGASNGTLVDNGDGTWTYTPNAGFEGTDSLVYEISDGELTDTATVEVVVADAPVLASDDFSGGSLGAGWQVVGPAEASVGFGGDATDAFLTLSTPDGNYGAWQANTAVRVMQAAADNDFQLKTRFLSTPTDRYQNQGFLVEQDAQNWLRFDTYSDGSRLYAFAAITVNGVTSFGFQVAIPGGSAPYLRLTRSGDDWTFEYSQNGSAWTVAGGLTHALTVSAAGLFSGNSDSATGYTALVDYFEVASDPILDEDGSYQPPNLAPQAGNDQLGTGIGAPLVISVGELLANDSDPNGDALSLVEIRGASNGTLVDNGDGTWTYTPNAGFEGTDSLVYEISDGELTDTATVEVVVADAPVLASDDFSGGSLGAGWQVVGPAEASVGFGGDATDAFLTLSTPDGNYDAWQANTAVRVMQAAADNDFQLKTRFLSTPTDRYQNQGFLVEQDAQNWLRFDTYSDGSRLYAFAAITVNGVTSFGFQVAIPGGSAPYLRLTRSGDDWTFEYSQNGSAWTVAGGLTHALTVSAAGLFSGNSDSATGYTALVDYFEVASDPILDEDGSYQPPNLAPQAGNDQLGTGIGAPLVISVGELLANDSDPNGDALSLVEIRGASNGTLVDNGDGTWTYTPNAGFEGTDSLVYEISDGELTDTATVEVVVADAPVLASDDFSGGSLGAGWQVVGPAEASVGFGGDATDAFLTLSTPDGNYDAWQANTAVRVMQAAADNDFQLKTRFLSTPTDRYQNQGFLVEQDAQNWLRFDTYSDGSRLYAFAAITVNGVTSFGFQVAIPGGSAPYLRLTRSGDDWTFEYSQNGSAWTVAGGLTHALTVSAAGLFSGNSDSATGYTALVDYFEVASDPILDEDGSYQPPNLAPQAGNDQLGTGIGAPLVISVGELLANDSDPNGDALSLVEIRGASNGTLVDNGDGTWTYTPNAGFEGTDSLVYEISDGELTDTATVEVVVGNPIRVWYGTDQTFGDPGESQTWINILGDVTGEVVSLSYSLNGAAYQALSIGPDTRRLQDEGDFNAEIAYAMLDGSAANEVVTIRAVMGSGEVFTRDVFVNYEAGNLWDVNYNIDWASTTTISDAVQIVDGTWSIGADGVRPVDLGYDRLLTLGDRNWDNFEISLQVTPHDLLNQDPNGRDGGGFGIGMLWNGHTDDPIPNIQPRAGWEPGAAFFFSDTDGDGIARLALHPTVNFLKTIGTQNVAMQVETTYNIVLRVEQVGLYDRLYSIQVWEEGTAEPSGLTLQGIQTFDIGEAPTTGGAYLNAHYNDVSFGDLAVTEITGRDIIQGTDGDDLQIAVDTGAAAPGQGEIDVLVGAAGSDTFVFGDAGGYYYDDGQVGAAGTEDYGFVWDFASGTDHVQLWGSASNYVLTEDTIGLPSGTGVWKVTNEGPDELVAVLNAAYGLNLNSPDFIYTDLFV